MAETASNGREMLADERDFLLASLADLEREHDAGDVDDGDYHSLKDAYTARAAAVLRALETQRPSPAAPGATPARRRVLAWVLLVVILAAGAGAAMARASGARRDGDVASGDPFLDTRQLLADAQRAAMEGDYEGSIARYTEALALQPANVEALTYRGWSRMRSGDVPGAARDLDAAIDIDPAYADVRVFRASVYVSAKDFDAAAAQLAVFDGLKAPELMGQIVASQRLRERIALGRVEPKLLVTNPPLFTAVGLSADDVFLAAQQLDFDVRVAEEVRLYEAMLRVNANDVRALSYLGWVLARSGVQSKQPTLVSTATKRFDEAVALDSAYPDVRVFRAFTLQFGLARSADARAELAIFDALPNKPPALITLITESNLRGAIETALAGK
jgi:tetratricopeptide (TPR) repeat protein